MPGVYRHPARIKGHAGVRDLSWRQPAFNPLLPNNSIQSIIYSGSGLSLQTGVSPAVVIGDTFQASNSSPGGYLVQVNSDGTIVVSSGGDTSRQAIQYLLFRRISGTYDGPGTVWVNEVGPVWGPTVSLPPVIVNSPISPINFSAPAFAVSPEGDAMVFALVSGTLPIGLTLASNGILSGVPTSTGAYSFILSATDITGTSANSPTIQIIVQNSFSPPPYPPPVPPPPITATAALRSPRVWGRIYATDGSGTYQWVAVTPDANGQSSYLNITWLIQVLKLNLAESPLYSNYGIPAQQSVITQIFPDYYVQQVQQQFSQYFASLQITKQPVPEPTYNVAITTFEGTIFNEDIPV